MFFFTRSVTLTSGESCIETFEDRIVFINLAGNKTLRGVQMFLIKVSEHFLNGRLCRFCGSLEPECSESEKLAAALQIQEVPDIIAVTTVLT